MGSGVVGLIAAVLAVTPDNGGALSPSVITINNQLGDQFDPHVDGDLAAYSSVVVSGADVAQQIQYYNFATNVNAAIPNALPGGGFAIDLLSDVDRNRIVFTRIADHDAIMLFDGATVTELAPAPANTRIGVALGADTVAFVDYSVGDSNGELMVLGLVPAGQLPLRLTNDTLSDESPAVSPDGKVIVWQHRNGSLSTSDVMVARLTGTGWVVSTLASSALAESDPDTNGTLAVFQVDDFAAPSVHIGWINVAGGPTTMLNLAGAQRHPTIRGNVVAFEHHATLADPGDIFLYEISSNRIFQLTNTPLVNESLNDVTILPGGEVRVVWQANDDPDSLITNNIYGATFVLPAVSTPDGGSGTCSGSVGLEASRSYCPTHWSDATAALTFPVVIPSALPVTAGNAGNKWASLTFNTSAGSLVCRYRGGASKAHPTTAADVAAGLQYVFDRCHLGGSDDDDDGDDGDDDGEGEDDDDDDHHGGSGATWAAGSSVTATRVTLHVHNGDHLRGTTRVALTLAEACSTSSHPLDVGGAPDARPAAGCSTGTGLMPLVAFAFAALLLLRRRPQPARVISRRR